MCRILSCAGKIDAPITRVLLKDFRKLAVCGNVPVGAKKGHRDGWGIVGYEKGDISVFEKNAKDASADRAYSRVTEDIVAHAPEMIMAHIRKSSVGKKDKNNSHPFVSDGVAFCHNGTIFNKEHIPLTKKFRDQIQGETDSERFFLYIMQLYDAFNRKTETAMTKAIIQAVLFAREELNFTALNSVISDGRSLWALREIHIKNSMVRKGKMTNYYTLYFSNAEKNSVVCSERIAGKYRKWRAMRNHELIRFDIKKQKYSSIII